MIDSTTAYTAEEAAQLIGFGLRPRYHPTQDTDYQDLVRRHREDEGFQLLTTRIAAGLGLRVVKVSPETGVVLASTEGSVFEIRMEDYSRSVAAQKPNERVLHGIIHLAVAALVYPRPADLADDEYTGRVTARVVDQTVREICRKLKARSEQVEHSLDAPTDTPELERAWRAYSRRPPVSSTKDKRASLNSTTSIIGRVLKFLTEQGLLVELAEVDGEIVYRSTPRYTVQIRELASTSAFQELLNLEVVPAITEPEGTLRIGTLPDTTIDSSAQVTTDV
ncbi:MULTISPECIES: membrane protein [Kitasatospora]|uniref:Uncharacterized protein n=1 Tax=Kitasatospora setae (strain ATCC 33774 / DSM 43861 / JCM 3304 / KCC A-0304 / NBRC 14216 / KM-6054) TaxID=452652 RepID=E4N680_KITSK|nr:MULTISPECIES: membrane protein [Kitasatospora]BAJ26711.1 hypothetical protein KSE_08740 [Kitasatospora setae KM-6054]